MEIFCGLDKKIYNYFYAKIIDEQNSLRKKNEQLILEANRQERRANKWKRDFENLNKHHEQQLEIWERRFTYLINKLN